MTGAEFEEALAGMLSTAASDSMEAALDKYLPQVDDTFIPLLAGRVDAAEAFKDDPANANPQLPQLLELNAALQQRVQARFERARDQLETLLGAGEINKLDAQLCALVRKNELDAGMFYVLSRNMADAKEAEDEETLRILTHVHTRLQEELEKKTEPALALLHKLTRTSAAPIRGNILRHNLVPGGAAVDGVIKLPDGTELPVDAAKAKALVTPAAFADAVSDTLEKVRLMGVERRVLEETAEEIRQVAKEARAVIEEAYDGETLEPRRAISFVGGRLALRAALTRLGAPTYESLPNPRGAPIVPSGYRASISHKDEVAVAYACPDIGYTVGVDVEVAELLGAAPRACPRRAAAPGGPSQASTKP